MGKTATVLIGASLLLAASAQAHFALNSPPAYSVQDSLGLPEKSAPCGQADPSTPVVPTNVVTSYHTGDMVTVTIDEKIFHPGHYRVAIGSDQTSLPADPTVTAADTACGSAAIEDSTTPGVIVDNMLPHTAAFTTPQSFQVQLPAGMTCTNCTFQVVEFMADHALNVPGGCFYHHCAQISIVPQNVPLPDAGVGSGGNGGAPADAGPGAGLGKVTGGCDASGGAGFAVVGVLGGLLGVAGVSGAVDRLRSRARRRRRREARSA